MTAADSVKAGGGCPWSSCPCARAARCTLAASDACTHLIQHHFKNCATCRSNGPCADMFVCFLDARDASGKRKPYC